MSGNYLFVTIRWSRGFVISDVQHQSRPASLLSTAGAVSQQAPITAPVVWRRLLDTPVGHVSRGVAQRRDRL